MLLAEIPGSFEVNDVSNEIVYTSITHFFHYNVFRTDWISRVRIKGVPGIEAVTLSKNDWSGLGHMVVTPVHDMTKSSKFYKILTSS